jgi:DUF4097 and DUF4098 domain-containing protein YvlB
MVFAGERTLPVKPGDLLDIDLNTGGTIQIVGSPTLKEAKVVWLLGGCDERDIRVSVENEGGRIRVLSEYTKRGKTHKCSVNINVSIHNRMNLEARTRGGNVSVSGVEGKISGETMGGNLGFKEIKGTLTMSTKGGNISVEDSTVDGKVSTMGGNINVKNVAGNIDASTMGGSIYLDNVVQREGHSISSAVNVSTMGGNIYVATAPHGANVETRGGNIIIEKASKFVQAETMGGNIEIKQHDGRIQANTKGGNVTASIVPGGPDQNLDIRSFGGKIELTLPAEFSGNFDLETKCSRRGQGKCQIQSDFPIQKRESGEGSAGKTAYGTGMTGGGANKVVVRTVGGNIVIKKR